MKKQLFLTLLLVLFTSQLWAQLDASLNGFVLAPQGQFKENVENLGVGIAGSGVFKIENTPFSIGLDIGGGQYGSETSRHNLVYRVDVDVTTSNNIFFMHLLGRIEEDFGLFVPYAEGLIGFSYLWTDSQVEDLNGNDENPIASDTHFEDWTSNYGIGGGFKIRLTDFENENENYFSNTTLFLDLKVRYMFGGEAEYLREGDITDEPSGEISFNPSKSETNFMTYHIGVVFYLF